MSETTLPPSISPVECIACSVEALTLARVHLGEALIRRGKAGREKIRLAIGDLAHATMDHLVDSYPELAGKVRLFKKKIQTCLWAPEDPASCLPRGIITELDKLTEEVMATSPVIKIVQQMKETPLAYTPKDLKLSEEEYAHAVIEHLSKCYDLKPPRVVVVDKPECRHGRCAEGAYCDKNHGCPEDMIVLLRGRVDLDLLAHEFKHYLDHKRGMDESTGKYSRRDLERNARKFASDTVKMGNCPTEGLNTIHDVHSYSESRMAPYTTLVGVTYGPQFLAKALERGFEEVDKSLTPGAPVLERASTWLNIGIGVAVPILGYFVDIPEPWDIALLSFGAHHATQLVDIAEEAMAPAARVRFAPGGAAAGVQFNPGTERAPAGTAPKGRYVITGFN